jgi:8-oxo-dGTP pyrophosphatase MutT (NUDIX family)
MTLDQVSSALQRPLPGLTAQILMSPQPRPGSERSSGSGSERSPDPFLNCRHAGVLLLLYPGNASDEGLRLVLTRRTESVQSHQGQISLPGGSLERGETAVEAAVREANEELSVDPAALTILGQLSPLYIPPSGFCMHPVVAYAARRPAFVPSDIEVAEVIEEPLDHLLDNAICDEEVRQLRGQAVRVPFYRIGAHKVWGATAMVLCEFVALLSGV